MNPTVNSCKYYMFKFHLKINFLTVSLYLVDKLVNQLLATKTEFPHCISLSMY